MIDDIEKEFGYILPNAYKSLVVCIKDFCEINFNESPNEFPEDKGTSWFFWGENRLSESVNIEGSKTRPTWSQLQSFVEIHKARKNKKQKTPHLTMPPQNKRFVLL